MSLAAFAVRSICRGGTRSVATGVTGVGSAITWVACVIAWALVSLCVCGADSAKGEYSQNASKLIQSVEHSESVSVKAVSAKFSAPGCELLLVLI